MLRIARLGVLAGKGHEWNCWDSGSVLSIDMMVIWVYTYIKTLHAVYLIFFLLSPIHSPYQLKYTVSTILFLCHPSSFFSFFKENVKKPVKCLAWCLVQRKFSIRVTITWKKSKGSIIMTITTIISSSNMTEPIGHPSSPGSSPRVTATAGSEEVGLNLGMCWLMPSVMYWI